MHYLCGVMPAHVGRNNQRALRRMSIMIRKKNIAAGCPAKRIDALLEQAMESRIRPISYARYTAIFDRIEIQRIYMCAVIRLIANQMLPVSSLPDPWFPTFS